jgi:hypothetical protein
MSPIEALVKAWHSCAADDTLARDGFAPRGGQSNRLPKPPHSPMKRSSLLELFDKALPALPPSR